MASTIAANLYGTEAEISDRRRALRQRSIENAVEGVQKTAGLIFAYAQQKQEVARQEHEDFITGRFKELNSLNAAMGAYPELGNDDRIVARHHQLMSEITGTDLRYPTNPQTGKTEIPRDMRDYARALILDPKTGGLSKDTLEFMQKAEEPTSKVGQLHHDAQALLDRGARPDSRAIADLYFAARKEGMPSKTELEGTILDEIYQNEGPAAALQEIYRMRERSAANINIKMAGESERKDLALSEKAIQQATLIKQLYQSLKAKGVSATGIAKGSFLGSLASRIGSLSEEEEFFRKMVQSQIVETMHARAGTAQSPSEAKRILAAIPTLSSADKQFEAALDAIITGEIFNIESRTRTMEDVGVRAPGSRERTGRLPKYARPGRPGTKTSVKDLSTQELLRRREELLNAR